MAGKQAIVSVQAISVQDCPSDRCSDARFQITLYVLAHRHAPADFHKEEHIGNGVAVTLGTQTFSAHLIHHGAKQEFLQEYLDEFCYKFNRCYFGGGLVWQTGHDSGISPHEL
jgi:hypothetical protein